jgi:succinate dehydrogenase / fumarate reductase cytochrome b subunit
MVLAGSGLALVLFLVLHLGGVSLALIDPTRFEAFSTWLHGRLWLPVLEASLTLALLAHPLLALGRWIQNRTRAGSTAASRRSRRGGGLEGLAAASGRWLPFSGGVLLLFLAVHLGQLRWSRPPAGAELAALEHALASPLTLILYGLAGLAVALHLLHGVESAHRSLGWLEAGNGPRIRLLGRSLAMLLGGGFALLPFALVLTATAR